MRGRRTIRLDASREIHLAEIYGPAAAGVIASPHGLTLPGFGMKPWPFDELIRLFHTHQGFFTANSTAAQLRDELAAARAERAELQRHAEWYRRQLRLESSFGLMLERIAG